MMQTATGLTSSGLRDWVVQRITAIILGFYFIFLFIYFICHPHLSYEQWHGLFAHPLVRIFSILALISLVLHAWVGIWTVLTDYIKYTWLRFLLETVMAIVLLGYLVWGIAIFYQIQI